MELNWELCRVFYHVARCRNFSRAAAMSPSIWVAPDKLADLVGRAKLEP